MTLKRATIPMCPECGAEIRSKCADGRSGRCMVEKCVRYMKHEASPDWGYRDESAELRRTMRKVAGELREWDEVAPDEMHNDGSELERLRDLIARRAELPNVCEPCVLACYPVALTWDGETLRCETCGRDALAEGREG